MNFWIYMTAGLLWVCLLVYLTVQAPRWLKLKPGAGWLLRLVMLPLLLVGSFRFALWAFGPSEELHAQRAEERRLTCLDTFCEGDAQPPNPDHTKYVLLKLNGKWFVAPNEYFNGFGTAVFYWPSKMHMTGWPVGTDSSKASQDLVGKNFYDVAIEVFVHRSSDQKNPDFGMSYLQRMESQGRVQSKEMVRPGLQLWRVNDGSIPRLRYVATSFVKKAPKGAMLSCQGPELDTKPELTTCTTGDDWAHGISWDTRFSGLHAKDWPEIYPEIIRVLSLLKEAQP